MTPKALAKRLLPPIVVDLLRYPRSHHAASNVGPYIWEGIYAHRRDVPTSGDAYDDTRRIEEFEQATRRIVEYAAAGKELPRDRQDSLPVVVASLLAAQPVVRILDFGGALAVGYAYLRARLRGRSTLEYHVIDLEQIVAAGRRFWSNDPCIKFHTSIPTLSGGLDVVYMCAVLPYIDDWKDCLVSLCKLAPRIILFTKLAVGDFPTYAARQMNLPGQVLAYWFINIEELKAVLADSGYLASYEDREGPNYDQANFPESHRMGQMRTMMFSRVAPMM